MIMTIKIVRSKKPQKVQLQCPIPTKPTKTAAKTCICTGPADFTVPGSGIHQL